MEAEAETGSPLVMSTAQENHHEFANENSTLIIGKANQISVLLCDNSISKNDIDISRNAALEKLETARFKAFDTDVFCHSVRLF